MDRLIEGKIFNYLKKADIGNWKETKTYVGGIIDEGYYMHMQLENCDFDVLLRKEIDTDYGGTSYFLKLSERERNTLIMSKEGTEVKELYFSIDMKFKKNKREVEESTKEKSLRGLEKALDEL